MKKIKINGGRALFGAVELSGSKNAALPIIFATVALCGTSIIENVPDIGDVRVATDIISELGAVVERRGSSLVVNTENLTYRQPRRELTSKIRASSYLIGACLARFGVFHTSDVGGCNFCNRPLDLHFYAAQRLGAILDTGIVKAHRLVGAKIDFPKSSVGATINALIMASVATGISEIIGASREPHVKNLVLFLKNAGVEIEELNNGYRVKGASAAGSHVRVIPDMIEAGTFLLAGPLTCGKVGVICDGEPELDSFLSPLSDSGIEIERRGSVITASGVPSGPIRITTAPHPGFPTDLQPQTAPLMARFFGGEITENVWQNRFSFLDTLSRFGLKYETSGSYARIITSKLSAACVSAPDLRGGAAAVLCALAAEGESVISGAELIYRGYERFGDKLRSLGAEISEF